MSNPPMYGDLLPLDREIHKNLKLDTAQSVVTRVADQNSVFLAAVEFGDACKEYPIVFVRAGNPGADGKVAVAPLAVLGLRAGSNLFVEGDQWKGNYVPAYVRRYPFCMTRVNVSGQEQAERKEPREVFLPGEEDAFQHSASGANPAERPGVCGGSAGVCEKNP